MDHKKKMRIQEVLSEKEVKDMEDLIERLQKIGFNEFKSYSSKKIAVLVPLSERLESLDKIAKKIPNTVYDPKPGSASSIGRTVVGASLMELHVFAKPNTMQGLRSLGLENENLLVSKVNSHVRKYGPSNIIFKAPGKTIKMNNIKRAIHVGRDTKGRKKADVIFTDVNGKKYPFSIKKDSSNVWESADTYMAAKLEPLITELSKTKHIELTEERGIYYIYPEVAIHTNEREKADVVFGSDLGHNGGVIQGTFLPEHFVPNDKGTLTISAAHIITKVSELSGPYDVYFLIRNDRSRNTKGFYPGLRVLAIMPSRLRSNTVIIDPASKSFLDKSKIAMSWSHRPRLTGKPRKTPKI